MVAKSASFGHGSLVCGLWLAGGGRGGSVPTYVLGTFYIHFFCTRATIYGKISKPTVSYHFTVGPLGDCRDSIFSLFLPFLAKKVVPDSSFSDARFFQGRLFDLAKNLERLAGHPFQIWQGCQIYFCFVPDFLCIPP